MGVCSPNPLEIVRTDVVVELGCYRSLEVRRRFWKLERLGYGSWPLRRRHFVGDALQPVGAWVAFSLL